jgi:hypothetical protein
MHLRSWHNPLCQEALGMVAFDEFGSFEVHRSPA